MNLVPSIVLRARLLVRVGLLALALTFVSGALLLEPLATTHLGAWYGEPALQSYLLAAGSTPRSGTKHARRH